MRYYIIRIYRERETPRNAMTGVVEDAAGQQWPFHDSEELLELLHNGDRASAQADAAGTPDPIDQR